MLWPGNGMATREEREQYIEEATVAPVWCATYPPTHPLAEVVFSILSNIIKQRSLIIFKHKYAVLYISSGGQPVCNTPRQFVYLHMPVSVT